MAIVDYNKVKQFISKIANIAEPGNCGNIFMSLPIVMLNSYMAQIWLFR